MCADVNTALSSAGLRVYQPWWQNLLAASASETCHLPPMSKLLLALIGQSDVGLLVVDEQQRLMLINRLLLDTLASYGLDGVAWLGQPIWTILPPVIRQQLQLSSQAIWLDSPTTKQMLTLGRLPPTARLAGNEFASTELVNTELTLCQTFYQAMQQSQVIPYYQPKINFADPQDIRFEALVRWQHPLLGLLTPRYFLPTILQAMCQPLFETMLQCCVQQVLAWRTLGLRAKVCLNVDLRQLTHPRFLPFIEEQQRQLPNLSDYIELELTETADTDEHTHAISVLYRLKQLGFVLAIDDFGLGYSSLSKLVDYPIDAIKIDKLFIKTLVLHARQQTLVAAVIRLAHELNLLVIAEGVETHEQLACLLELGCDAAQGYLFGKPMPAYLATRWLQHPPKFTKLLTEKTTANFSTTGEQTR